MIKGYFSFQLLPLFQTYIMTNYHVSVCLGAQTGLTWAGLLHA